MNILIDTNIALYFLAGDKKLADLIDNAVIHLSFISEMELLSYPDLTEIERQEIEKFIDDAIVVNITVEIKRKAISVWQESEAKLPDAIIAGTAITEQLPFLTADSDFERVNGLQLFLYEL